MTADLHLHSTFSDGTYTPAEISRRAVEAELGAIALTDHDTVEGCEAMAQECARAGLEFIPGAELTAEHLGQEVHILGYWLDRSAPALLSRLAGFQAVRVNRIHDMVRRLNRHGVPLQLEAVFAVAQCHSPGRPHVARALVMAGLCRSFDDAFDRYLKRGRPGWAPKTQMPTGEAIALIHSAGGLASLAHPGLYRKDAIIEEIASDGLDGLEVWHTRHTPEASEQYRRLADSLGLAATGGSDCHGEAKGQPLIGRVKLAETEYNALKERRSRRAERPPVEPPQGPGLAPTPVAVNQI